ncbi:MAG: sulfite oxidase-like oxidoreductase [Aquificaceae bacterium]
MRKVTSPINLRQDRLPPGQKWIKDLITYDIVNHIPHFDIESYRFRVFGQTENPMNMTYGELLSLPSIQLLADFHCVTHWSVKDILWEGIPTSHIVSLAKPKSNAKFVMVHCLEGYTTNVPVEYLLLEDSILAFKINGQTLPKERGFPIRLVIPQLYAWKSAKYVWGFEFMEMDMPGFWEQRGYNMRGNPWKEERYW